MRGKLLEELQLSVAVMLSREEVVPRFRVICPDGEWTIFVPLPDDITERQRRMQLVYGLPDQPHDEQGRAHPAGPQCFPVD